MPNRLLIPALALFAATALFSAMPLAAQVAPGKAAKAFTLDSVAPTPTPAPTSDATPPADDAASVPAPSPAPMPAPLVDPAPPPTATVAVTPLAPTVPTITVPTLPESAAVTTPVAAAAPPVANASPAVRAVFTLDTPIQDLIADPVAKGVLDKDLPGMSNDENLDKFKMLSLRSLQPQTGGQLNDAMLAKVASDLDVLGGGTGATTAPVKVGNAKRGKDDSR